MDTGRVGKVTATDDYPALVQAATGGDAEAMERLLVVLLVVGRAAATRTTRPGPAPGRHRGTTSLVRGPPRVRCPGALRTTPFTRL